MKQRSSALARAIAATALVAGFVLVIAVAAISLGEGDGDGKGGKAGARAAKTTGDGGRGTGRAPKSYVVQNGDTLTSIAHRMGVSVSRIQELNPGVDPQILVSGEKLKLR
jgi:LysM repeat protein